MDRRLQDAVDHAMSGRQGALVVLNVRTGSLIAYSDLERAAGRRARPGSAIKPFTLLALLEAGVISGNTSIRCSRVLRLAGRELDCTHAGAGTLMDPVKALALSCNSFFAQAALRIDGAALAGALERCGLGAKTSLVPAEAGGIVHVPETDELRQLLAIGEAAVEVTPLTLAAAYRKLVLWLSEDEARLRIIHQGLRGAVAYGTAQLAGSDKVKVAGKTGTAMSRARAWSHGWFCGFAPADAPAVIVTVFLENGRGGPDAAPLARSVFEAMGEAQ